MCVKTYSVKVFNALVFTASPIAKPVCVTVFKSCHDIKMIENYTQRLLEVSSVKPYKIDIIPIEIPSHLLR